MWPELGLYPPFFSREEKDLVSPTYPLVPVSRGRHLPGYVSEVFLLLWRSPWTKRAAAVWFNYLHRGSQQEMLAWEVPALPPLQGCCAPGWEVQMGMESHTSGTGSTESGSRSWEKSWEVENWIMPCSCTGVSIMVSQWLSLFGNCQKLNSCKLMGCCCLDSDD